MKGVCVLFFLGILGSWASDQFLNHRPFPTYSLENMPSTGFTCRDKILGGYYADPDTQCQMFHICVKVLGVGVQDFRFLCPNGTAFDQDHQICADWEDVDCDSTTLYYSSDNFDLYRIGSGFESKAFTGEDEETFALQRAETGDHRLNREHQSNRIDQTKEVSYINHKAKQNNFNIKNNNNRNNNDNSEKEIFKASSSSNFFNNRNNGKEKDEDYDDNVNVNQDRDYESRRKVVRNKTRRPAQKNNDENNKANDYNRNNDNNRNDDNSRNNDNRNNENNRNNDYTRSRNVNSRNSDFEARKTESQEPQNRRTTRPVSFNNNFAGSSYLPTTVKPSSTTLNNEQYTTAVNNYRSRNGHRQRQYTPDFEASSTPVYTISTPAPFRQTQQYNVASSKTVTSPLNGNYPQQKPTTKSLPNLEENYDVPKIKPTTVSQSYNSPFDAQKTKQTTSTAAQTFNTQYEPQKTKQTPSTFSSQYDITKTKPTSADQTYETKITKIKQTSYQTKTTPYDKTENYPSNNPVYSDKKTTPLSPRTSNNFPTTFAPRTNAAYTEIAHQTVSYTKNVQFSQYSTSQSKSTTPKGTPFSTRYTPTVPKVSSTTPVSRSNRFDETEYDDGSYSTKNDYDGDRKEDEFLKTAHSQNIAASRNELEKSKKQQPARTTQYTQSTDKQTQYTQTTQRQTPSTQKPTYQTPKPFSAAPSVEKATTDFKKSTQSGSTKSSPAPVVNKSFNLSPKKTKDVSYDYAYYDSGVSSEADYDIDTEIKKSTAKN